MTKQPEALRLADECDTGNPLEEDAKKAAVELRRLHEAENQRDELLKALKEISEKSGAHSTGWLDEWSEADAFHECQDIANKAIAKTQEK